jgi:hypothetical protein
MNRLLLILMVLLTSCMQNGSVMSDNNTERTLNEEKNGNERYPHLTTTDSVHHIVDHPAFIGFGNYTKQRQKITVFLRLC